ncbi:tubulin-like doman-containing protein [soil metagenome]
MLTLTRVDEIQSALNLAWQALQQAAPWGELPHNLKEEGPYDNAAGVIPIVVGSTAGGSGASMFLDVCRVMGRISGLDRRQLGVFLFTPDVFSSLDVSKRKGIDGNAIAALGELFAAQVRASDSTDNDLMVALGLPREPESQRAFGRVFPVGASIGGDGARFGDSAEDIYRGLGRALAATISSDEAARQYLQTRFENPLAPSDGQEIIGWGSDPAEMSWGSFGYSSLSLGRDRYAQYSSQRLARSAVDCLVDGYLNPSSPLPPTEQLDQAVASQWPVILERLRLGPSGGKAREWLRAGPLTIEQQKRGARSILAPSLRAIESIEAKSATAWTSQVHAQLPAHQLGVAADIEQASYVWVESLATDLERSTLEEVLRLVAHPRQGLPYARKVLVRLQREVADLVTWLKKAPTPSTTPLRLDLESVHGRAKVELGPEVKAEVVKQLIESVREEFERSAARISASVLTSYAEDVLGSLHTAVNHALENLDASMRSTESEAGLAHLHTEIYNEWPQDSDLVPPRFDHAHNEVLLTTSDVFPAKFREHVEASRSDGVYRTALETMVEEIVRGSWDNVGAEPSSYSVISTQAAWRAPELRVDAATRQPTPQSKPTYRIALTTHDLLERAFAYQARKDQAFERFSGETFEGYLNEPGITDAVRDQRNDQMILKFEEAAKQAQPLVGVSGPMVEALHHDTLKVELTFSTVPLAPGSRAAAGVLGQLASDPKLEQQTIGRFEEALSSTSLASKVAIYGGYPKYFPLVYSSVLSQLKERWAGSSEEGKRELWKWKRTRPLTAAVGMSRAEQLALVRGWYLGRGLGLVYQPADTASQDPVQVFDPKDRKWRSFSARMLTARDQYRSADGFDWLPGVFEGHTLAVVDTVNDTGFSALAPYRALRRIYDMGVQPSVTDGTSADQLIADWIASGTWPSGEVSQIRAVAGAGVGPDARARALRGWINDVRDHVASTYLTEPTGPGLLSERRIKIQSIEDLEKSPMFAEIAALSFRALGDLLESIDRGFALADGTGESHGTPQV